MSAEALLEDPALFNRSSQTATCLCCHINGGRSSSELDGRMGSTMISGCDWVRRYLTIVAEHPPADFHKCVKAHCLKLLHRPLRKLQALTPGVARMAVSEARDVPQLLAAVDLVEAAQANLRMKHSTETAPTACSTPSLLVPALVSNEVCAEEEGREIRICVAHASASSASASSNTCASCSSDSWYRRHRNFGKERNADLGTGRSRDEQATDARVRRKAARRENYKAMGYRV
mmetsp:Transcript_7383/g.9143  ORF Transcript_7383/g.9143 Transcript_7383/m.9143 type:complete len:232 (-) Transcript_7383:459-1154(-)